MFKDTGADAVQEIDSSYTSRVAEIFNVILKSLSIGVEFVDNDDIIQPLNNDEYRTYKVGDKTIICTEYEYYLLERKLQLEKEILDETPVMTESQLSDTVEKKMIESNYIMGPLFDENGNMVE